MKNNLTDSIYKAWRTGILPLVTALLLLTGCEMDSDMDQPLNVDSNKYTLTSDAGSTQVRIYSTGEWSVPPAIRCTAIRTPCSRITAPRRRARP